MNLLSATLGRMVPRYRTLAEWAEIYSKVVRAKPIQDKTKQNRASYIRRIVDRLGRRCIGSLRAHDFAAYINEIAAEHPHLARRMLIEARDMLREAVAYGWIDRDPTVGVKTPRVKVIRRRLTFEQWQAIREWAERNSPPWVPHLLTLALVTGQRRGDLREMRFSDVWDEVTPTGPEPHLHIVQQKTGERVAIPLSLRLDVLGQTVGEAIEACRQYAPAVANGDALMLRKTTGDAPVPPSMSWRFEQAREGALGEHAEAGSSPSSLHECRSLSARLYANQGVTDVQTLLGHTDESMTDLYLNDRGLDIRSGRWRRVAAHCAR